MTDSITKSFSDIEDIEGFPASSVFINEAAFAGEKFRKSELNIHMRVVLRSEQFYLNFNVPDSSS